MKLRVYQETHIMDVTNTIVAYCVILKILNGHFETKELIMNI